MWKQLRGRVWRRLRRLRRVNRAMTTESQNKFGDRVGIGWRSEIAAGILSNLDRIDVLELIADDLFEASRKTLRAIRTLASQVPLILHGVSSGMASASPVK